MRAMTKTLLGAAAIAGSLILSLGAAQAGDWDHDHDRDHWREHRRYVEERPVYVAPRPVYVAPAPIIVAPVVPVAPMPVGPPSLNFNLNAPL